MKDCGFESRQRCVCARLAQMVERMTLNHVVAGSIPAVGGLHIMSVDSSMVRIRAFQARGPGSIPGRRTLSISRSV